MPLQCDETHCMNEKFETLGNATIQFFADGRPILATDPWLKGTCYFGSWALDHALTEEQIGNAVRSDYIWLSHGHPDHLHHESLDLLPRGMKVLLPDHYDSEIRNFLTEAGFAVTVLPYRRWHRIAPTVEVMCLDNINQDAVLIVRLGDALVINLNDSPLAGEFSFLRSLIRRHPNDKTYLAALCSIDADMFNFVDGNGCSIVGPPDERKPGAIWNVARIADRLGVKHFCCSSSQHIYVRPDSIWANDYRISWQDIQKYWSRPNVALIEPFATVDVATGAVIANDPEHLGGDRSQISDSTGDDDWNAKLSEDEWRAVESFFRRFELVARHVDFIEVAIGGETRRFTLAPKRAEGADARGIRFHAPKHSFMETMKWGFFDDLLIGNFMKVHLTNTSLYPRFTPLVAKLGGNAKVYTAQEYRKFRWRYFRRNPVGTLTYYLEPELNYVVMPWLRSRAEALGLKQPLKYLYRTFRGDPIAKADAASEPLAPPRPDQFLAYTPDQKPALIVVVDTEENFDWNAPYSSASVAVHGMRQIDRLQSVFERHGVRPIYMIDYAVASQGEGYGPLIDLAATGRCEIGTHLHPWVNPPVVEELSDRNSYPCNLPPELEEEKLLNLTRAVEANLGVRPKSYKAGRYGIGAATPEILMRDGYLVDLSVVPTQDYSADGGPDFSSFASTRPYWLDDGRTLLELPLTTGFIGSASGSSSAFFGKLNSGVGRLLHLPGIFARLGLLNRVKLTPEGVKLSEAKALTRHLLARGEHIFTMAFHSTSLTPGSTPYVTSEAGIDAFCRWLDEYFTFFSAEIGGTFVTPLEVYGAMRGSERPERSVERVASAG
jgi:hypothetical protein